MNPNNQKKSVDTVDLNESNLEIPKIKVNAPLYKKQRGSIISNDSTTKHSIKNSSLPPNKKLSKILDDPMKQKLNKLPVVTSMRPNSKDNTAISKFDGMIFRTKDSSVQNNDFKQKRKSNFYQNSSLDTDLMNTTPEKIEKVEKDVKLGGLNRNRQASNSLFAMRLETEENLNSTLDLDKKYDNHNNSILIQKNANFSNKLKSSINSRDTMYNLINKKNYQHCSGSQIRNSDSKETGINSVIYSTQSYNDFALLNRTAEDFSNENSHLISKFHCYQTGASQGRYQNLKESKVPRLRKYLHGENRSFCKAIKLVKKNELRKLDEVNNKVQTFLYGNPIHFDVLTDKKSTKKVTLLANSYMLCTMDVSKYNGIINVSVNPSAKLEFFISTLQSNPDKSNCDFHYSSVSSFSIIYENWDFINMFMKVIAFEKCGFDLSVGTKGEEGVRKARPYLRFSSHSCEIGNKAKKRHVEPVTPIEESLLISNTNQECENQLDMTSRSGRNQTPKDQTPVDKDDKPKGLSITPASFNHQLIEIDAIDVFLKNDFGNEFVPKEKKYDGISFVEANARDEKFHKYSRSKDRQIKLNSKKYKEQCLSVRVKKKEAYQMYINNKLNLADRHNQIRNERVARESAEEEFRERRFKAASWIFYVRIINFMNALKLRFNHLKIKKFMEKIEDKKIRRLQKCLKASIIFAEDRETRCLAYTRYATRMAFVYKRPIIIKKVSNMIGVLLYGWGRASHMVNHFQSYVLTIKQIQMRWRYTICWKQKQAQIFNQLWEKEIMYVNDWEVSRQKNLAAKKLPRDKFQVSNNQNHLSRGSCQNFSDFLLNQEILNYIDTKFQASEIWQSQNTFKKSCICKDSVDNFKIEDGEISVKSLDEKKDDDKASVKSGLSNINEGKPLRFKRSKLEKTYSTNRWLKFAELVKKAEGVKEDFIDYEPPDDLKSNKNVKIDGKTKKKNTHKNKKKKNRINESDVETKDDDHEMIELLMAMTWNKNLRLSMPKQLHQEYKPDPPLIRAQIYYICQNVSKNTVQYEHLEDFDLTNEKSPRSDIKNQPLEESIDISGGLNPFGFLNKNKTEDAPSPKGILGFLGVAQNLCKITSLISNANDSEIEAIKKKDDQKKRRSLSNKKKLKKK